MALLATGFTLVGTGVTLGRRWLAADVAHQTIEVRVDVLVPLTRTTRSLSDFSAVGLTLIRGASDSADQFQVRLLATTGAPVQVASSIDYAAARACAAALAAHAALQVHDSVLAASRHEPVGPSSQS